MCYEGSQQLDGTLNHIYRFVHQPSNSKLHHLAIPTQGQRLNTDDLCYQEQQHCFTNTIADEQTYFAIDDACVDLQYTCSDMRVRVMQMLLQCVKETVTVSSTGLI